MYVVFPEVSPVDDRIIACASWLEKKRRSDIKKDDVSVAFAVGLNHGIEAPELFVIQLLVFAR